MSKPILYGHPFSPFVRKTMLALALQGVDYEFRMVAPHSDDAGFRAASPLGKIPAFQDEHTAFADSSIIIQYLQRFYDGQRLLPETPADYARSLWFEEYADTVLVQVIGGHLFAEVVLAGRLFPREPIQADIDKAVNEELPAIYPVLNEALEGRNWLAGDAIGVGDLAVGSLMVALYHCGQTIPDSAPELQAFVARFFALPEVQARIEQEIQLMQGAKYDTPLANYYREA